MAVYKPTVSRFWAYDFQSGGRRFHGSTGETSRAKAVVHEAELRRKLKAGELSTTRATMSIDDAANRWWEEVGQHLARPANVERRVAVAVELLGLATPLNEITTAALDRAIQTRRHTLTKARKPLSNATINHDIIRTVRPILRRARLSWGVTGLPEISWRVLMLPEPKPKARDFTDDQVTAIIAALPEHWRAMAGLMARYGLRLGEVFFSLERLDIDGRRLTLTDRKGGDDHVIPLLAADVTMLAARAGRARAAGLDSPWFRVLKGGRLKALAYGGALQAIHEAMRETGLKASRGARVHDLRHHAGTRIMRATGNLRIAQRLLGHASIQSTIKYAYASDTDLREGLEKLVESRNNPGAKAKTPRKSKEKQSSS